MSLHNLARDGLIDELRLQIAQGRDVNVTDSMKRTPLILAAHRGHLEAVQVTKSELTTYTDSSFITI